MSIISATALFARRASGRSTIAFVGRQLPAASRFGSTYERGYTDVYQWRPASATTAGIASSSLRMSTEAKSVSASSTPVVGFDFVRTSVVEVLNEIFDPAEIAKGAAIAKLDGKKKKKKKKKQPQNEDEQLPPPEEEEPKMTEEQRTAIIEAAIAASQPFSTKDAAVTPATKPEFGDYQCNAAMSLAKSAGLNPRECAQKIVDALTPKLEGIMELPFEIAGPGFINLKFRDDYLAGALGEMSKDCGGRLAIPLTE